MKTSSELRCWRRNGTSVPIWVVMNPTWWDPPEAIEAATGFLRPHPKAACMGVAVVLETAAKSQLPEL